MMSAGQELFAKQLRALGVKDVQVDAPDWVVFHRAAPSGRYSGDAVRVALKVPPDFPRVPPHGPHIYPRRRPNQNSANTHPDKVIDSARGPDWERWSRPYPGWKSGRGCARIYLKFLDHLLETTP